VPLTGQGPAWERCEARDHGVGTREEAEKSLLTSIAPTMLRTREKEQDEASIAMHREIRGGKEVYKSRSSISVVELQRLGVARN
jgi:hypothetical protein